MKKVFSLIFLLMAALMFGEAATADSRSDRSAEIEVRSDLGFDAKIFAKRFNSAMTEVNQPYRAKGKIKVNNNGVQGVFHETFSEHLSAEGTVSLNSGAVDSIVFIGSGDGSAESGARVMVVASGIIAASQPSLTIRDGLKMMMSLVDTYEEDNFSSKILNGVEYTYLRNEVFGNILLVESADS